jgi:hypothetical protein
MCHPPWRNGEAWLNSSVVSISIDIRSPGGQLSNLILQEQDSFNISIQFRVDTLIPSAQYRVDYFFEALGTGPEGSLGSITGQLKPNQNSYGDPDTTLKVSGGTLSIGVYRTSGVVRVEDVGSGFSDGPVIQIVP